MNSRFEVANQTKHNDGATVYGMGQQVYEDSCELDDYLKKQEKLWSSMLGQLIFKTTREELKGPGALLTAFETLADRFSANEEPLSWLAPFTNFPVVQNYRKSTRARTWLQHGEERFNLVLETWDETTLDHDGQRLGASPNLVHSLDATHLWMTVSVCDFDLALVHDSYGCCAGRMSELFARVREQFVRLYKGNPLEYILEQMDSTDLIPPKGNLDINLVLESDYVFA